MSYDYALAGLGDAFGGESKLKQSGERAGYAEGNVSPGVNDFVRLIIDVALSFLGVVFVLLTVYGGYMWMTASGNDEQVQKGKKIITAAIIGLVIVVSAYAISWFVINQLGGQTLE